MPDGAERLVVGRLRVVGADRGLRSGAAVWPRVSASTSRTTSMMWPRSAKRGCAAARSTSPRREQAPRTARATSSQSPASVQRGAQPVDEVAHHLGGRLRLRRVGRREQRPGEAAARRAPHRRPVHRVGPPGQRRRRARPRRPLARPWPGTGRRSARRRRPAGRRRRPAARPSAGGPRAARRSRPSSGRRSRPRRIRSASRRSYSRGRLERADGCRPSASAATPSSGSSRSRCRCRASTGELADIASRVGRPPRPAGRPARRGRGRSTPTCTCSPQISWSSTR